jgi:catechol 2,3-dioxygenase-like lactoylglutathione lyase family enzyme
MKITGSNVTIMVKDMDRSINFYQSLGLTLNQRWDNNYAMMGAEGITLGIHPAHGETSSGTLSIGFFIDKCENGKAVLDAANISYEQVDDGASGIYLHFKDPDGTIVYFVEPKW